jgi:hypothetical protein
MKSSDEGPAARPPRALEATETPLIKRQAVEPDTMPTTWKVPPLSRGLGSLTVT